MSCDRLVFLITENCIEVGLLKRFSASCPVVDLSVFLAVGTTFRFVFLSMLALLSKVDYVSFRFVC